MRRVSEDEQAVFDGCPNWIEFLRRGLSAIMRKSIKEAMDAGVWPDRVCVAGDTAIIIGRTVENEAFVIDIFTTESRLSIGAPEWEAHIKRFAADVEAARQEALLKKLNGTFGLATLVPSLVSAYIIFSSNGFDAMMQALIFRIGTIAALGILIGVIVLVAFGLSVLGRYAAKLWLPRAWGRQPLAKELALMRR